MKTGSELVKEWRVDGKKLSGDAALTNQSCADELQAWLREADKWLNRTHWDEHIYVSDVRDKLLGTTQEGK